MTTASPAAARWRQHRARWIASIVLVVGASLVALLATRPPAAATEVATPLLGRSAPALSGTTLTGQPFDLAGLRGRWVVVNFFASWCPPCRQEEAELVTFAFAHRQPGGAALVGVVYDDSAAAARSFLVSSGATWPALADPDGAASVAFGVRAPPETFIVSPAGTVVAHLDGPVTAAGLDYWLERAQGGTA
jgi:cytochrome c biogenesis protein CcmG/thiol:disulfide interchange protein DsbE